jgi:hypothetical protein
VAQQISASVGKGGANTSADVFVVQFLLSNWRAAPPLRERLVVPALTGRCDPTTITAIGLFQQVILKFSKPDCRVDPGGRTFKRLAGPVSLDAATTLPTAFTTADALKRRAEQAIARGDKYVGTPKPLTVAYAAAFDDFAARAAHELRHDMVYRSDGGRIARGIVRGSGDLKLIHEGLAADGIGPEDPVALVAHLFRRRDKLAPNQWVMSIRFRMQVSSSDGQTFDIPVDPVDVQKQLCTASDKVISAAALVAAGIQGEPGKRIRKMVAMADQRSCQHAAQLWYYNRPVAIEYFTWRTSDSKRREMTSATGGRMPFDGHVSPHGKWRLFPFKRLAQLYGNADTGLKDSELKVHLLHIDGEIFHTFADIDSELARNGLALGELNKFYKGGSKMYGLAEPFLHHLIKLQKSSDHLYSAYR